MEGFPKMKKREKRGEKELNKKERKENLGECIDKEKETKLPEVQV